MLRRWVQGSKGLQTLEWVALALVVVALLAALALGLRRTEAGPGEALSAAVSAWFRCLIGQGDCPLMAVRIEKAGPCWTQPVGCLARWGDCLLQGACKGADPTDLLGLLPWLAVAGIPVGGVVFALLPPWVRRRRWAWPRLPLPPSRVPRGRAAGFPVSRSVSRLGQPEDPLCRPGALPPSGVSPRIHARLCATRAIALALRQQARAGAITDLEALARLFEATRPLYERRFLFFRRYDLSAQVWDLAVIVGGLEIRSPSLITFAREGWTFLRTGRLAHPEAFFEIIDDPQDPNSPYSPYYLGFNAFQDVGFKKIYQDGGNQVRHFMAGVGISYFYGRFGEQIALSREQPESPDYRLYVEGAFAFAHLLELYAFHTGGPLPDIGDWLRRTLGN
jgi:hypothetical protein